MSILYSAQQYLNKHREILGQVSDQEIFKLAEQVAGCIKYGKNIWIAGCGGSLLNAMHFAQDLMKRLHVEGQDLKNYSKARVMCLNTNPGLISAIENDLGHERAFIPELETFAQPGDLFIAISVSGTSKNLVQAVLFAAEKKLLTAAITGNKNAEYNLASMVDVPVVIPNSEFSHVEDISMTILHYIIYNIGMYL